MRLNFEGCVDVILGLVLIFLIAGRVAESWYQAIMSIGLGWLIITKRVD